MAAGGRKPTKRPADPTVCPKRRDGLPHEWQRSLIIAAAVCLHCRQSRPIGKL